MQEQKAFQDGQEGIDKLLLLKVLFVRGLDAFCEFDIHGSHTFFVYYTGGDESGLEKMIVEDIFLFDCLHGRLEILIDVFGVFVNHEYVVGLEFMNREILESDAVHSYTDYFYY